MIKLALENKKFIIVIPIEVKTRELNSRLLLSLEILKRLDCEIIIGSQRDMGNYFSNMKNCLYLDKSISIKKTEFIKKIKKKNTYFSLDEEGSYYWFEDLTFKSRFSKKLMKFTDKILLWGKNDEIFLRKKKIFNKKKFYVLGNPKFDLIKKKYSLFYDKDKSYLIKKYGKFVLCVSSFVTNCDNIKDSIVSKEFIKKNYLSTKIQKKKYEKFVNDKRIYENYLHFVERCKQIALKYPNKTVIFRPHPFQDIKLVKKRFGKMPNNFKIIFKNELSPWIMACDYYIHAGCSSVLEAVVLKKKIINFTKMNFLKRHFIFKKITPPNLNYINKDFLRMKINSNKINIKDISEIITNLTDYVNYNEIVKVIKIYKRHNSEFFKENIFKRYSRRSLSLIKNYGDRKYFTKKYKDTKLKEIKLSDIKTKVSNFDLIDKKKNNFQIHQFDYNLFKISRSN